MVGDKSHQNIVKYYQNAKAKWKVYSSTEGEVKFSSESGDTIYRSYSVLGPLQPFWERFATKNDGNCTQGFVLFDLRDNYLYLSY